MIILAQFDQQFFYSQEFFISPGYHMKRIISLLGCPLFLLIQNLTWLSLRNLFKCICNAFFLEKIVFSFSLCLKLCTLYDIIDDNIIDLTNRETFIIDNTKITKTFDMTTLVKHFSYNNSCISACPLRLYLAQNKELC